MSGMDLADLSFKPSKRLKRIITTVAHKYKDNARNGFSPSIYIRAFEGDETVSLREDEQTYLLLDYLADNNIAEVSIGKELLRPENVTNEAWIVTELEFVVNDIKSLQRLHSELNKQFYEMAIIDFDDAGDLIIDGLRVRFQRNTPAYEMLKLILREGDGRDQVWSYSDDDSLSLKHRVYQEGNRTVKDFCRHTGNYINKRVKEATGQDKFLLVSSKSIQLNPDFV